MRYLFYILIFLSFEPVFLTADVLPYEDSYLRFEVPEGWAKQPETQNGMGYYFNWNESTQKFFYQIHRNRKWAQWHMKGLHGKKNAFVNKWKKDANLSVTGEPLEVSYDPDNYILSILWQRDRDFLVSKMRLTAFGCLAFHKSVKTKSGLAESENLLENIVSSINIPEHLEFYPEDLASELINNMGGAVAFIIVSLLYIMFSLFQRSQMRQRRMEEVYSSRLSLRSCDNPS